MSERSAEKGAAPNDYSRFGVWSDAAGGFIYSDFGRNEVAAVRLGLIEQGEDADDLTVLKVCPWHEEQPADTCEEC